MQNNLSELQWLYEELEEIRNPPFSTIFVIVLKGYISLLLITLMFAAALFILGLFFTLLIGGTLTGAFLAFWNWISQIEILPTFSNFLILYLP
jgi:hypothetical protein